MSYLDFKTYNTVYKGKLTEQQFNSLIIEASLTLDSITRKPGRTQELLNLENETSYKIRFVISKIVDLLFSKEEKLEKVQEAEFRQLSGISSEKVASLSRTYTSADNSINSTTIENQVSKQIVSLVNKHLRGTGLLYRGVRYV